MIWAFPPPISVFAQPQRCDHPPPQCNNAEQKGGGIVCCGGITCPSLPAYPPVTSDWLRYLQTCERRPSNLRNHSGLGASKFLVDLSALSSWFRRNQITHERQMLASPPRNGNATPLTPPAKLRGKSGVKEAASCLPPQASC